MILIKKEKFQIDGKWLILAWLMLNFAHQFFLLIVKGQKEYAA